MRVAIMQPYFLPYAGYFRLLAATDLFVIYDCVQFPRRGWVHRNRLRKPNGELEYLTLPLTKASQDVRIDALRINMERQQEWSKEVDKYSCFHQPVMQESGLSQQVRDLQERPVDYISGLLKTCCRLLEIPFNVTRSSALNLPYELRGQDRILAIARHFRAETYVNAPGGRALYDAEIFQKQGIKLRFLTDYQGDKSSIAQRLADANFDGMKVGDLAGEIYSQLELCL